LQASGLRKKLRRPASKKGNLHPFVELFEHLRHFIINIFTLFINQCLVFAAAVNFTAKEIKKEDNTT